MEIRSIWLKRMRYKFFLSRGTPKQSFWYMLAVGVVGMSYGSLAAAYVFRWGWCRLSFHYESIGASEFMFIGIIASGGNPLAAAAGLLVNARRIPFGVKAIRSARDAAASRRACSAATL